MYCYVVHTYVSILMNLVNTWTNMRDRIDARKRDVRNFKDSHIQADYPGMNEKYIKNMAGLEFDTCVPTRIANGVPAPDSHAKRIWRNTFDGSIRLSRQKKQNRKMRKGRVMRGRSRRGSKF